MNENEWMKMKGNEKHWMKSMAIQFISKFIDSTLTHCITLESNVKECCYEWKRMTKKKEQNENHIIKANMN